MTYNFDPDRWFENHRRVLDDRRARGELDAAGYEAAMADLEARYDQMQARLDRAFEVGHAPLPRRDGADSEVS